MLCISVLEKKQAELHERERERERKRERKRERERERRQKKGGTYWPSGDVL